MSERRPTVVVADDHALLREEIVAGLEENGFLVVGEEDDALGAVCAALDTRPDLCLLDVNMPGDGVHAAEQIARQLPETRVVMFTSAREGHVAAAARAAGARGYLLKDIAPDRLAESLHRVLAGELAFPRGLLGSAI